MVEHAADTLQGLDPLLSQGGTVFSRNRAAGLSLATGELNTRLHEAEPPDFDRSLNMR
jgi:hypothetical protein